MLYLSVYVIYVLMCVSVKNMFNIEVFYILFKDYSLYIFCKGF